jgi:Class II Aldolase and Adducin N-terminal domain
MRFVDNPETAVLAAAKDMLRRGLVEGTAGNISARREDANLVITPSSVDYEDMALDDLVLVDPEGVVLEAKEGRGPSTEMQLHLACYRAFDDIGSVIHSHPVWATMFAVAHQPIPAVHRRVRGVLRRGDPLRRLRGLRHPRCRPQRGEVAGRPGGHTDRQPRAGGRRGPAPTARCMSRLWWSGPPRSPGVQELSVVPCPFLTRSTRTSPASTPTCARTRCSFVRSWACASRRESPRHADNLGAFASARRVRPDGWRDRRSAAR